MKVVINRARGVPFSLSARAVRDLRLANAIGIKSMPIGEWGTCDWIEVTPAISRNPVNDAIRIGDTVFYSVYGKREGLKSRADPDLVTVVETLGPLASSRGARLVVVDIPVTFDQIEIEDGDGERIRQKSTTWGEGL